MNCTDARRALGAEPDRRTPELDAHLAGCEACATYAADLVRLEALLRRALEVPVPAAGARASGRRATGSSRRPLRRVALAASLVGAAILSAALWSLYPREVLASALVEHMAHEPQSRRRSDVPVAPAALAYVLKRSGVALAPDAPLVSYAQSCWFRGRFVPHLVVQTPDGPMTVMLLPHERVAKPATVDEGGYRVIIVPAAQGAIAVLVQGAVTAASVETAVARVTAAVRFTG
jgi:Protein of unknown function (DUF3379)